MKPRIPNPFSDKPDDPTYFSEFFWSAFVRICELRNDDIDESLRSLAEVTNKPTKFLRKRLGAYLRVEQAKRLGLHHGSSTLH